MKVVKKIVQIIMAFFLSILILANFLMVLILQTVLQKGYVLAKVEEVGYEEKIQTDLKNGFENYQYQSGLPASVFENLYTRSSLQADIYSVVNSIYENEEVQINSEEVRTKLEANIQQYLSESQIVLKEAELQNIKDFENIIVNVYENRVNSIADYVDMIQKALQKGKEMVNIAQIGLIVALVVFLLISLVVQKGHPSEFMNQLAIALLSSGVILILMKKVIHQEIDIQHILLLNQSFSDFVKYVMFDVMNQIHFYGMMFAIVGFCGIIWSRYRIESQSEKN